MTLQFYDTPILCSTGEWHSWRGYAFESVCYRHLKQIKKALNLPPLSIASSWRYSPIKNKGERGAQIDLLFDRRDNCITICEIKCTDQAYIVNKNYMETLARKKEIFLEVKIGRAHV